MSNRDVLADNPFRVIHAILGGRFALVRRQLAEYEREQIAYAQIVFPDNSSQLALLDAARGPSVFGLLDEECRTPNGSDAKYVAKMHDQLSSHAHYSEYYDEKTRRIVEAYVGADLRAFGYTFETPAG